MCNNRAEMCCKEVKILKFLAATAQDSVICDHKTSEPSCCKAIDGTDERSKRKERRLNECHIPSSKDSNTVQTLLDRDTSDTLSVNHDNKQGNGSKKMMVTPSKKLQAGQQRKRYLSCGKCVNCCKEDCGKCVSCKDKPKFGGNNTRKQRCIERICLNKVRNILYCMTGLVFF